MKRTSFCVVFALLVLCVECQYVQSPCPGLFEYQSDGGGVHGVIQLAPNRRAVSTVHLRANFTIATQLTTRYVGQIQLLQKYKQGVPLSYRVNFPVTSPLPRLTSITVNGEILCYGPGDIPRQDLFVTTISLDHMLYSKSGVSSDPFQYVTNEGPIINFGPLDENTHTQVFTFNDLDDRNSGWNSGYFPLEPNTHIEKLPNMKPPQVFQQPVTRPTRPGPVYTLAVKPAHDQFITEQTTRATRPPPPPPPPPTVAAIPSTPPRLPASPSSNVECGVIAGGNERIPLIYNGNTYPRGEWPWLVAIYKRQEGSLTFICSGTLVSDRHVVTAAHCMHQKNKISAIKDMVVKVGVYNLEDWGDDVSVTRTLITASKHESYNATTLENDILVLTMERTVEFNNYIRPACLWSGNVDLGLIVGDTGVVAGWGASEVSAVGQGVPRMVRIPVVSTAACRASKPDFHKLTSSKTLCAGDRNGSGPCLGDSGGGLYILEGGRWRIRGVVSLSLRPANGENTCNLNEYIVFTDTAQYLNWIRRILSQNFFDQ